MKTKELKKHRIHKVAFESLFLSCKLDFNKETLLDEVSVCISTWTALERFSRILKYKPSKEVLKNSGGIAQAYYKYLLSLSRKYGWREEYLEISEELYKR